MHYNTDTSTHTHIHTNTDTYTVIIPFPQIDIIEVTVIVWRVRGKILSSVLCNIMLQNNVHSAMHTHMNRPNSSLDWVLGPFH